ncbi:homoserine O-acetyltransferase [Alteromonas sp. D210916BOD_24]|uniref:E22 family MetX-like putative esterase n=1 Tax=Alteromonas sp. D210916BOD_24 TaxID=3157618 RepID=UPI00399CE109
MGLQFSVRQIMRHYSRSVWLALLIVTASQPVLANSNVADTLWVEKQTFTMASFTTFGGKTIRDVKVGWEAYGQLNDTKSNVILITHYFSGTSHAAGKYQETDPAPGYWDSLIGPGKAIDTNRYYVVSVDTLVNLNAYDENVITTGPASINPDTGKPYGLDFPVVTIRDFVNVQKALLESLGIAKLHAVVGPSMGSMQAIEWVSAYPDWVERMVSVIGTGESDAWTVAALEHWATPIKLDRHWNNGNYGNTTQPVDGLAASLMLITQNALTPDFFNTVGKNLKFSNIEQGPLNDINDTHSIVAWLKQRAYQRSKHMDANHLLYLVRACQLFVTGHQDSLEKGLAEISANTLFIPSQTDLLLMPYLSEDVHQALATLGNNTRLTHLSGQLGHLEGVTNISAQAEAIKAFLDSELKERL